MRGAVFSRLRINLPMDRIIIKNIGVANRVTFRRGYHPPSRKVTDANGVDWCEGVMDWFLRKVYFPVVKSNCLDQKVEEGYFLTRPVIQTVTRSQYKTKDPPPHETRLLVCVGNLVPVYDDPSLGIRP